MTTNQKPNADGVDIPFGHETAQAQPGEPLILIRAGATVPQRLRAAAHVASAIADQLEAVDNGEMYAFIFKRDADPVEVHVGTFDAMATMFEQKSPNWSTCYLARIVNGPGDELRAIEDHGARNRAAAFLERAQLRRVRDVAIAHIEQGDTKGALAALLMQRDMPELFDRSTFDEARRESRRRE